MNVEQQPCETCQGWADWKIQDLLGDRVHWSCHDHVKEVIGDLKIVRMSWQEKVAAAG